MVARGSKGQDEYITFHGDASGRTSSSLFDRSTIHKVATTGTIIIIVMGVVAVIHRHQSTAMDILVYFVVTTVFATGTLAFGVGRWRGSLLCFLSF